MNPGPFILSALFILMAIPLWMKIVPPNRWYGVRTAKTLADADLWYRINARCGRVLIAMGFLSLAILLMIGSFWSGDAMIKNIIAIATPLALLGIAIVITFTGEKQAQL